MAELADAIDLVSIDQKLIGSSLKTDANTERKIQFAPYLLR
jgi:hypothetical protein